ncbi:hypothetical protein [Paenibacillus tyrfis]|uniref:hypothetical protein n=1 Tax=Paenibacillus tyrfis TaxID=1501230 RepID=UPI00117FF3FD|nr:hypothetical protein [Paenibacillus tyrfis]
MVGLTQIISKAAAAVESDGRGFFMALSHNHSSGKKLNIKKGLLSVCRFDILLRVASAAGFKNLRLSNLEKNKACNDRADVIY